MAQGIHAIPDQSKLIPPDIYVGVGIDSGDIQKKDVSSRGRPLVTLREHFESVIPLLPFLLTTK